MNRPEQGSYHISTAGGETVRAFVPHPLPPVPPLELLGTHQRLLERATHAVGRLDSVSVLLPDPQLFLYAYVRREAVCWRLLPKISYTPARDPASDSRRAL